MRKVKAIICCVLMVTMLNLLFAASADTLKLPKELKVVEAESFYGDSSIDVVDIPYGAQSIASKAFANSGTKQIYIPCTVTQIAEDAFSNVDGLTIFAENGSCAWEYAEAHDIRVESYGSHYRKIYKRNNDDIITFGFYNQGYGLQPIEWKVLENNGDCLKLISVMMLNAQPYNEDIAKVTWETCSLRSWLNDTFLNDAFTAEERSQLVETWVSADKNPDYGTKPGNDTLDKVWLLSIPEVYRYFPSEETRICDATLAVHGMYVPDGNPAWWWWLRTPGSSAYEAACIDRTGNVKSWDIGVNIVNIGVRPVISLRLS